MPPTSSPIRNGLIFAVPHLKHVHRSRIKKCPGALHRTAGDCDLRSRFSALESPPHGVKESRNILLRIYYPGEPRQKGQRKFWHNKRCPTFTCFRKSVSKHLHIITIYVALRYKTSAALIASLILMESAALPPFVWRTCQWCCLVPDARW